MDSSNYKDRQLILRCLQAAGDTPSPELVALAPAVFAATIADPLASPRDKIRASEGLIRLQQLQLQAVTVINQVKSRRQSRRVEIVVDQPSQTVNSDISRMIGELESESADEQ